MKELLGYAIRHNNGKYYGYHISTPVSLKTATLFSRLKADSTLDQLKNTEKRNYVKVVPVYISEES